MTNHILSTNAKIIINNWSVLQNKLIESTTPLKNEQNPENNAILLSDQQLDDALNGPLQSFFTQKLNAYSKITTIRLLLTMMEDETLKTNQGENQPSKKDLSNITLSDLEKIEESLSKLTEIHYEQWSKKQNSWSQKLITAISTHNIILSEIETKELNEREPLSQLKDRFIELNLPFPIIKIMNFKEYLYLKSYLTLHSALSRQQQPHNKTIINALLKKMNAHFNQIHQEEIKLIATQRQETEEIIKPLPRSADISTLN